MRVLVPGFRPESNGLRFANAFPHQADVSVDLPPPFGRIALGDAANGLCGGMSCTVADLFKIGSPPPEDPDPPAGGTERFDYLVHRQIDTLDLGRLPARFLSLMSPARPRRQGEPGLGDSRTNVMVASEWPAIRADLDRGDLAMVGLVKVVSADPRQLNHNHQVLAYGYELEGADLQLLILDPNYPRRELRLGIDPSDAMGETAVTYGTSDGAVADPSVVCFFHYPYAADQPVPWGTSHRADDGPAEPVIRVTGPQVRIGGPDDGIVESPDTDWAGVVGPILAQPAWDEQVDVRGPILQAPGDPTGAAGPGVSMPGASTPTYRILADAPPPAPTLGRVGGIRLPNPLGWARGILSSGTRGQRRVVLPEVTIEAAGVGDAGPELGDLLLGDADAAPPPAAAAATHAAEPGGPAGPPHVAYGLVDCLAEAVADLPFDVTVGLGQSPAPGVAAVPMDLPPLEAEPYSVFVRLVAPGFAFARGQSRRRELRVSTKTPYPTETVRLIPRHPKVGDRQSVQITAEFSMSGVRIADAIRMVTIVATADARTRPATEHVNAGVDFGAPTADEAADLTITIRYADRDGWLAWTLDTPHTDVVHPTDEPTLFRIGSKPEDFLRNVIAAIGAKEGKGAVYTEVLGLGQEVAGVVPPVVWQAIRAVATKTGRPPTILLVSEEPYIPWELAVVEPALVPSLATAPPFLAAQARIGRWLQAVTLSDGRARPSPKPPMAKQVRTRVVIWGDYSKTEWPDLTEARDEANALIKDYGMVTVDPTNQAMFDLLRDRAGPDLMHFAVHGHWSEDGTDVNGIVLTDGETLEAPQISGRALDQAPVVFLNACQVGAGQAVLGQYSGIAAAFVQAGACGVIAPLWSINDAVARGVAIEFYKRVAAGEAPSEVLRSSRSVFVDSSATTSATTMAYQFFGHPGLTVTGLS